MDKFVKGYQEMQLVSSTPVQYSGANQFATHFQRVSVLTETPVRYSSHSIGLTKAPSRNVVEEK